MSKLIELYNKRKQDYDNYLIEKTKYETLVETYTNKIATAERSLFSKFDAMPEDIKEVVSSVMPNRTEVCNVKNARERLHQWHEVYKILEEKGISLLGGDNNDCTSYNS